MLVYTNERFAYQPLRPETVDAIYRHLGQILPGPVNYFDLTVFADGKSIEELIPNLYRKGKKDKARLFSHLEYKGTPWVTRTSRPYDITRGLEGRHIALWQSHGKYYINDKDKWGWQRPRLFCTTEDQFTQSFILPYLLPMLENAGANVFTPRERDTQKQEVIVDNDGSLSGHGGQGSLYLDVKSRKARWKQTFRPGFAQRKRIYQDNENPFLSGTARFAKTEKKINSSFESGHGTVLFFEDASVVGKFMEAYPLYSSNFKVWSQHTSAMHQFTIWTMLEDLGFGASLQHYNPLIDEEVKRTWHLPKEWELVAQMPFGMPLTGPGEKTSRPLEERVKVFK